MAVGTKFIVKDWLKYNLGYATTCGIDVDQTIEGAIVFTQEYYVTGRNGYGIFTGDIELLTQWIFEFDESGYNMFSLEPGDAGPYAMKITDPTMFELLMNADVSDVIILDFANQTSYIDPSSKEIASYNSLTNKSQSLGIEFSRSVPQLSRCPSSKLLYETSAMVETSLGPNSTRLVKLIDCTIPNEQPSIKLVTHRNGCSYAGYFPGDPIEEVNELPSNQSIIIDMLQKGTILRVYPYRYPADILVLKCTKYNNSIEYNYTDSGSGSSNPYDPKYHEVYARNLIKQIDVYSNKLFVEFGTNVKSVTIEYTITSNGVSQPSETRTLYSNGEVVNYLTNSVKFKVTRVTCNSGYEFSGLMIPALSSTVGQLNKEYNFQGTLMDGVGIFVLAKKSGVTPTSKTIHAFVSGTNTPKVYFAVYNGSTYAVQWTEVGRSSTTQSTIPIAKGFSVYFSTTKSMQGGSVLYVHANSELGNVIASGKVAHIGFDMLENGLTYQVNNISN